MKSDSAVKRAARITAQRTSVLCGDELQSFAERSKGDAAVFDTRIVFPFYSIHPIGVLGV
jgi:hypothetical protein